MKSSALEENSRYRILIIDDDEQVRKAMARRLSTAGFEAATASDGKAGLGLIKNKRPDLVLLDIDMPGLSGFEVCRLLREDSNNNSLPILMLTGEESPSAIVRSLEQGADDYLVKTEVGNKLLKKVNRLLLLAKTGDLPGPLYLEKRKSEM